MRILKASMVYFLILPMKEEFLRRLEGLLPAYAMEHFGKPGRFVHFRVNLLKISVEKAREELRNLGVSFEVPVGFSFVCSVLKEEAPKVLGSPLSEQGLLYAQGLESMKAVIELDPQPGEAVLDLCAAPGSKTSQIAAGMNNEGLLVANEPIRQRFYRLKSVIELTGTKAKLSMADGRRFRASAGELFDRVLVDAPCSSEGRFKYDNLKSCAYWSVRKIREMAHKQKGLLLNASRLVKDGGTLVYSTCTFAKEENEEVVEWLSAKAPQMVLQSQQRILPDGIMEGFFIAKWRKI